MESFREQSALAQEKEEDMSSGSGEGFVVPLTLGQDHIR